MGGFACSYDKNCDFYKAIAGEREKGGGEEREGKKEEKQIYKYIYIQREREREILKECCPLKNPHTGDCKFISMMKIMLFIILKLPCCNCFKTIAHFSVIF